MDDDAAELLLLGKFISISPWTGLGLTFLFPLLGLQIAINAKPFPSIRDSRVWKNFHFIPFSTPLMRVER
jgi:hypothetical protein